MLTAATRRYEPGIIAAGVDPVQRFPILGFEPAKPDASTVIAKIASLFLDRHPKSRPLGVVFTNVPRSYAVTLRLNR
jgi:hypothetical protein